MAGFEFLEYTNSWLEKLPNSIDKSFEAYMGKGDISQEQADKICAWMAWKINIEIERERQRVIKALHGMYMTTTGGRVLQIAMAIKVFVTDPLKMLGVFASALVAPITSVFQWASTLSSELPKLGKNLARVASVSPHVNSKVSYSKFKLKVGSISLGSITQGSGSLPSPETMFPEPERPWTKNDFDKEMNSNEIIEKKFFYEVPKEI